MIGTLYIVKNKVNNKIYIGKTYLSLEKRWNTHIYDSTRKCNKNRKLYKVIKKLGVENFYIEELGKYEEGILEQKEIEYIEKYNSFINGYNMTFGGDGKLTFPYSDKEVIQKYQELKTVKAVAKFFNCDVETISKRLKSNNIKIISNKEHFQKFIYIPEIKRCFGNVTDTSKKLILLKFSKAKNFKSVRAHIFTSLSNNKKYLGLSFIYIN